MTDIIDDAYIREANLRHDVERHFVCMDARAPMKSTWRPLFGHMGKLLSDKKIDKYVKLGFYSDEFRAERKAYQAKKAARRRSGNFVQAEDGRFIYSPI